ncbi:MAG: phosphotransferase [Anaerolineae bacterium]|nr:phosphotransferase [Anaerolineae bacterium]
MVELHGDAGVAWLEGLPRLVGACERQWSLTAGAPFVNLSYNYVAPAVRADGTPAILKIGFPNPELTTEIAALALYDGRGCARLLAVDPERGALLIERLVPGTPLAGSDDEAATRVAAGVMRRLWRPAPVGHAFPTVARWAQGLARLRGRFDGGSGPLPRSLVERAEGLFADLLESMGEPVLLHGDLHHANILRAERETWLAIDPKGVVGEAEYDVGALLRNPLPWLLEQPDPAAVAARRVAVLADMLGFDPRRILGWGVAQAVLSAWWSIEDHGSGWEPAIRCAEIMHTLLKKAIHHKGHKEKD